MEKFITDERTGLQYELVGGLLSDCRRGRAGGQTNRHMGTAAFAVSETAPQDTLFRTADKRKSERLPCRPKRAGRGYVLSTGKTTCRKGGCNGITQSGKPNAVGAKDEQRPQHRYGGCFKRFNLRITNIYRKAAVKRQRLFFFGK